MTLTGEIKILDDKVWFGEKAAKISAFSSKNLLEKYEYLTGEDLGKTKFNYSPLGMSLSKSF